MQADTTINSLMFHSINSGDNTYQAGGGGIAIIEDVLTTPKGIALNSVGIEYDNGTSVDTTTWSDITTRVAQLSAIAPNNLNASVLAINDTISIQNADTAPTRIINTQAGTNTGGEHFGVEWIGNTLPFIMQTLDATPLQVVDTSFVLVDSVAPLSTTMTATDLTSGATTRTWADILASSGSTNNLQQVLANGNTATGASATIGLTNSGVGGLANPSLVLTNSNATINTIPTIELNKTGRNLTAGESVGSISMYGLDAVAQKTEFARIQTKAENVASGNEDGTLSIFNSVNGAILETFNFNGGQNENNSFRPLDLNGNALRTTSGSLTLDATASSGTGNIDISAKSTGVVNINSNVVMDNSETLMMRNTANTIYNSQTQSSIGLVDITTPLNSNQHILTNTLQSIINQQATTFTNESDADLTSIRESDNSTGLDINRVSLSTNAMVILNNTNPTATEQLDMNATSIQFTSGGSAIDSLNISNDSASGGLITWSNTTGANGLEITSDRPLTFSTTANAGAGNGDMIFNVSSTIGNLAFNGANIQTNTSTGSSGQYLIIRLNGTYYKIPLDNI